MLPVRMRENGAGQTAQPDKKLRCTERYTAVFSCIITVCGKSGFKFE